MTEEQDVVEMLLLTLSYRAGYWKSFEEIKGHEIYFMGCVLSGIEQWHQHLGSYEICIMENVGVCNYLIPYELHKKGTSHIHHIATFCLVQILDGTPTQELCN